ncbi:MAG: RidA family protein [Phycisphaerales bacterium]
MNRTNISTNGPWEATNGYSRCVKLEHRNENGGHTEFVFAGTTAMNPDGSIEHEDDAGGQTRTILQRVGEVLAQHGAGLEHVISTRLYITDAAHAEAVGRAHGEVFRDIRPAATLLVIAGLVDPRMLVEIEVRAVAPN